MWIVPTEADLLTRVSGAELSTFRSAALAEDQPDPVVLQMRVVVDYMRGYIGRCPHVNIGPEGTIPERAMHVFLDLAVPVMQTRPAGMLVDPEHVRKAAKSDSIRWLEAAAACDIEVDADSPLPARFSDAVAPVAPFFFARSKQRRTL